MKNILLVDDNKYLLDALTLTIRDCAKDCNSNGKERTQAADILDRNPVDLVLTDIEMPVMNGFQLIEHKNRAHPSIPLLAMTSDASPAVVEKLKFLGVNNCIEKPFGYQEVMNTILGSLAH